MCQGSSVRVIAVLLCLVGALRCRVAPELAPAPAPAPSASDDDDDAASTSSGAPSTTSGSSRGGSASVGGSAGRGGAAVASQASPADDSAGGEPAAGAPGAAEKPAGTGSLGASAACGAQTVTFDEIQGGEVRASVKVEVSATATSQKFLLSHARSGSCLFAAFAGTEPASDGPRGLLVVSYGDDAPADESCALGTDAIPDDLAAGDAVSADGYLGAYAPSGCEAVPSPQLMVDASCPLVRSGRRAVPAPFALTLEEADAIARGTDAAVLHRFAGGLVRLASVSAARPDDGTGAVGPYGVIALNETALGIHNDVEYGDLSLGGPGDAGKSLVFPYPTAFASVTGLVYLDYCSWSLAPRSRCVDLVPGSSNCLQQ